MIISQKDIENRIFTFRSVQVMIDSDLAEMYGVETKVLNQAVKRNIERFPETFRFQLTANEYFECSRSQIVTLNERGSLKDLGKKWFAFSRMDSFVNDLSNKLKQ